MQILLCTTSVLQLNWIVRTGFIVCLWQYYRNVTLTNSESFKLKVNITKKPSCFHQYKRWYIAITNKTLEFFLENS